MAVVRELLVSWGFEVDEKPLKKLDDTISSVKSTVFAVGAVATAAAVGIFGLAKAVANVGDEAGEASQRVGWHAEALQELQYVTKQNGVSNEELEVSLKFLNKAMTEAADKAGDERKAFKSLGISVKDADGNLRNADEILLQVSNHFAKMPDGQRKAQLATTLFGRAGLKMIPTLNLGADAIARMGQEARALGAILDEDAVKNADEFNDTLAVLEAAAFGVMATVGKELIPVLTDLAKQIIEWVKANRQLLSQNTGEAIAFIGASLRVVWSILSATIPVLNQIVQFFGGWGVAMKVLLGLLAAFMAMRFVQLILHMKFAFVLLGKAVQAVIWALALNPWLLFATLAVAAIVLIIKNWDDFVFVFKEAWLALSDAALGFWTGLKEGAIAVFDFLAGIVTGHIDMWVNRIMWFVNMAKRAFNGVKDFLGFGDSSVTAEQVSSTLGSAGGQGALASTASGGVSSSSKSVNVNSTINLSVPSNMSATEKDEIDSRVRRTVREEYERANRALLSEMP